MRSSDIEAVDALPPPQRLKGAMTTKETTRWALFNFGYGGYGGGDDDIDWMFFPVDEIDASLWKHKTPPIEKMVDDDDDDEEENDEPIHRHSRKHRLPKAANFQCSEPVYRFSSAVLGSILYVVGGFYDHSDEVKKFELSAASAGELISEQTVSLKMRCARYCPLVLPLNGKLFVFGGFRTGEGPWGEIYDPFVCKSTPLDPPEGAYFPEMAYRSPCPYVSFWATMGSKIVFGSYLCEGSLVLYTLVEGDSHWTWIEEIISPMPQTPIFVGSFGLMRAVAIGHTLLWFAPGTSLFVAFDLIRRVSFVQKRKGIVHPIDSDLPDLPPHLALLHEGNDGEASVVCLLFAEPCVKGNEEFSLLHCVTMNVWIDSDQQLIVSQILGCQCMRSDVWWEPSHQLLG